MKKHIEKPAAVEVGTPTPFSFDDYIKFLVSTCREFNMTGDGIRAGLRVEDALASSNGQLVLDEKLYELLVSASEKPSLGYPVLSGDGADGKKHEFQIARKLLPFIDAVKNAVSEE